MIKISITIYLFLMSSLIMAASGLKYESIEVKVTQIDLIAETVSYVENNVRKTMKLDEEVVLDGYYTSDTDTKDLDTMMLNKKYFLRIARNSSIDGNGREISKSYVSFISTVPYDTLY